MPRSQSLSPDYSAPGHLIGVSHADSSELLEISQNLFLSKGFAKLAYFVSKNRLRIYVDEFFSSYIENLPVEFDDSTGFSSETALAHEQPVRCLVVDIDNLWTRLSTMQEYKFVTGTDPLAGIGIYTIFSKEYLGINSKHLILDKVVKHSLESLNLTTCLMTAIVQPDQSWQIALVQMNVHSPKSFYKPMNGDCASVSFALFDPASLISSIISGKSPKEVEHVLLRSLIPLDGDMSYYYK